VITQRDGINTTLHKIARKPRRQPRSTRGILPVGDHPIELHLLPNPREFTSNKVPARPPDDVTDKQQVKHGQKCKN
jgi:hypothetical protein